ncbi:MAG: hypothetical protein SF339_16355 [Blastocatellia bacterium]|nr:hypothetical protein [Blastocatellia bacterium]
MKKDPIFAMIPALACLLGACMTGGLLLFVVIINAFVPTATTPFFYVEYLNIPILSIALPVVGMLILAPVTLRMAFSREEAAAAPTASEATQDAPIAHDDHHLKAA